MTKGQHENHQIKTKFKSTSPEDRDVGGSGPDVPPKEKESWCQSLHMKVDKPTFP
jgi:hypothetical protein